MRKKNKIKKAALLLRRPYRLDATRNHGITLYIHPRQVDYTIILMIKRGLFFIQFLNYKY